jgi:predicted MFS family arabinose efflux permease
VVSGLVAEHFGWRAMFGVAALSVALLGAALWRGLPRFEATISLSYQALLHSLWHLLQRHGGLRRAALSQGLLSMAFSAFWSTLAVMLHGAPFHLGSAVAGAFGLAGAAGALIAPVAGHLADRHGPERVTRLGTALTAIAFLVMALGSTLPPAAQLGVLVLGTIGFDLGVQASLIAHQTIIYGLEPAARSRLNAVLLASMFVGMASGSALGSWALGQWGWLAVTLLAAAAAGGAWLVRVWPHASTWRRAPL